MLATQGNDCSQGQEQAGENDAPVDLVLTDIVMDGGMSGYDVAQWVQSNRSDCKIMLTSGFNEHMAQAKDVNVENLRVLQKPYGLVELQEAVSDALKKTLTDTDHHRAVSQKK